MKSRGSNARSGDVIPYVFCLGDSGESSKSAQAERAKHPEEVRKAGSDLKIGNSGDYHAQAVADTGLPLRLRILLVAANSATDRAVVRAH